MPSDFAVILISGKVGVSVREEVAKFAILMEKKLLKHDVDRGRQGWKDATTEELWDYLTREVKELDKATATAVRVHDPKSYATYSEEVGSEAADVANMAMMIADVSGALDG